MSSEYLQKPPGADVSEHDAAAAVLQHEQGARLLMC